MTEATAIETEARLRQAPLPAPLLEALFRALQLSVATGKLNAACAQVERELPDAAPQQRFDTLARMLQLRGARAAMLRWHRLDQRRLPVLVFHNDQWWLAKHAEDGRIELTGADGSQHAIDDAALHAAPVLWVRTPTQEHDYSVFSSRNIAARMVLRALLRSTRWLRDVSIATVIVNVLAVSTSIFVMQVYDRVVPTQGYATLWTLVAGMGLVVGLDWLLKTVRARTLDSVASEVDRSVSQQVFEHVMRLRLDLQPRSLGTLAAQVGGLDSVRQFFSSSVVFALIDLPFALMFMTFIWIIGGGVVGVYLVLFPVAGLLGWVTQHRLRRLARHQMQRTNERQGLLVDSIRGAESIRANNAGWRFAEDWQAITASMSRYSLRQKAISNLATVTTSSLSITAYVAAVVVGVGEIEAGNLTTGGLIACSILGGRVIAPIAQAVQYLSQWQNVSEALQLVNQVLCIDTERRPDQNLLMPERPPRQVSLEGVRFAYPQSPLQQLNVPELTLAAGDRVLLLGPVGGGKSTLLKVLAGLYRPSEGRVRLGDGDLWETDPQIIANTVGYLPQAVHLFKGTLRSNLTLSGAVNDSRLLEIARELGIDRFAERNPLHMDLEISEGGDGLSGGQRQLVALARVLLARPTVWLLDEPTASLDASSEAQALRAIEQQLRPDDILVLTTHRPVIAAGMANRVIVMDQGEVRMDGPPEQVIPGIVRGQDAARPVAPRPGNNAQGPYHVV